jgi:hypothetical protein
LAGRCASRVLQSKSRSEQRLRAAINVAVAFEGHRIRRVEKGAKGTDIIHEIVQAGKTVGKKNRGNWKSEYATKLCKDQIAEKAEFAILPRISSPRTSVNSAPSTT